LHWLQIHDVREGVPGRLLSEGELMLVIDPDECIDCGVCAPECEAKAILPDTDSEAIRWLDVNARFASVWPTIFSSTDPLPTAQRLLLEKGKYVRFFETGGDNET
jgi:ferredoxin